jgi:hypothetical protein
LSRVSRRDRQALTGKARVDRQALVRPRRTARTDREPLVRINGQALVRINRETGRQALVRVQAFIDPIIRVHRAAWV